MWQFMTIALSLTMDFYVTFKKNQFFRQIILIKHTTEHF